MAVTLIFKEKKWKQYGKGADSYIKRQTGGAPGYFIPSEGLMEQAEMDYIVEAQEEKAKNYKPKVAPRKVGIETCKDGSHVVDVKDG